MGPWDVSGSDTIAAIVTPLGKGGVGIIRISGPNSLDVAKRFFVSLHPEFKGFKPRFLHHGQFRVDQKVIDEVLLVYMPAPRSYTGEDVVEINCHGGPAILHLILEVILQAGVRLANPGEFTYRAFLNNKMDLTQAEAVAELINAPGQEAVPLIQQKLEGGLRRKVSGLKARLEGLRQEFCVAVDFPEEEIECLPPKKIAQEVSLACAEIKDLLFNYEQKHLYTEGALVVLAGQVNAGKSSLLNALLGKNRAIVTPIPGTTRDYLEEFIQLQGLPVKLVDTAGLRQTTDQVESLGLERTLDLIKKSDLCLLVVDSGREFSSYEQEVLARVSAKQVLLVLNKCDLYPELPGWVQNLDCAWVQISALTGQGLKELQQKIVKILSGDQPEPELSLVPNLRQKKALERALAELESLMQNLGVLPYDLLAINLDLACEVLKEITGEITSEEILNQIFSRFCIGK